jgi:hypothetical protein
MGVAFSLLNFATRVGVICYCTRLICKDLDPILLKWNSLQDAILMVYNNIEPIMQISKEIGMEARI